MVGKTLSHYKVLEKIGQGGMGEVYRAEDTNLSRKVALKILPQHLSDRAELRERFEREARAVSSLKIRCKRENVLDQSESERRDETWPKET